MQTECRELALCWGAARSRTLSRAKIRIISQSYSLLPLKVTKRHKKRARSRADIFGLGSRPCVSYIIIFSGGYALISSNAPVSESMINPRTTISFGTSGWVLMVSTVFLTDVGVSLKPSNHWSRSMPHLGDNLHFSGEGYRLLGRHYAQRYLEAVKFGSPKIQEELTETHYIR